MNMVRPEFYSDFVNKMSGDPRKLFAITKKMLNQVKESPFPEHCNKLTLANELGAFFKMKVSNTRSELDAAATFHNNHSTLAPSANCFQPSSSSGFFSNFELLSKDSVKKLVLSIPTKSCPLDPVPTKVVKECLDDLVPLPTIIINQSLQSGVFPDVWKEALVTPTLKKCGSDLAFNNFRPISNLQFVSKLVERAAADQLQSHRVKNNLFPTLQSAYRPNHSTEPALLKIKNDILMNMDKHWHTTLLTFLDFSAAFDAVDHQILLNRLRTEIGVSGKVLVLYPIHTN